VHLKPVPTAGNGVHVWTFYAAHQLHEQGVDDPAAIIARLTRETVDCGRDASRCIRSAVEKAMGRNSGGLGGPPRPPTPKAWPATDPALIAQVAGEEAVSLSDWIDASPEDPRAMVSRADMTERVVDALFPGNPLICVATSTWRFSTVPREKTCGKLHKCALIVPSPMSAKTGITQDGKVSEHSLDNTGPRRWLVIDLDSTGDFDAQACVIRKLARMAPLALIVQSGGKSLHAWFWAFGTHEKLLQDFMRYACALGADHLLMTRSQFARMPGGVRIDKERTDPTYRRCQEVCYFNPACGGWEGAA